MNAKHTPTPWRISDTKKEIIWKDGYGRIAVMQKAEYKKYISVQQANAEHIIHCVNLHDELVECLRRLRMHCTDKYDAKQIDDLLLKAKGE